MNKRTIHYFSGLFIAAFVALHLVNHAFSLWGAARHIEVMTSLRVLYRHPFFETILLLAIAVQIYSGLTLFRANRRMAKTFFERVHIWTGLYLAGFFIIHLSAVFAGRLLLHLDTNFYFGVAGLNYFPANLFFIPYYSLAMISFWGHLAAIHSKKMTHPILGLAPARQSKLILAVGVCVSLAIVYGLTNQFTGVEIPAEYNVLIGR